MLCGRPVVDETSGSMAHYVEAFEFVAEFEILLLGTNANVKYKSS